MKGIIAVPTSSHFYLIKMFALALTELRLAFQKNNLEHNFIFSECSWIEDGRNNIWKRAKKLNPDWMLWIDSDMIFSPGDGMKLVKWIQEGADMVSGLYFAGAQPHMPLVYKEIEQEYKGKKFTGVTYYNDYPKQKDLFEIAGCGFGFCAVSKNVIESLDEFPFRRLLSWTDEDIRENSLGEDLSFCKRVKNAGFNIYCDKTVSLGHVRQSVVDEEFLGEGRFYKMI